MDRESAVDKALDVYGRVILIRKPSTLLELRNVISAFGESSEPICAEIFVTGNDEELWIWGLQIYEENWDGQLLLKVWTSMNPDVTRFDPNAGIDIGSVILLKGGTGLKKYKTLNGLFADIGSLIGAKTPFRLVMPGDSSEMGDH